MLVGREAKQLIQNMNSLKDYEDLDDDSNDNLQMNCSTLFNQLWIYSKKNTKFSLEITRTDVAFPYITLIHNVKKITLCFLAWELFISLAPVELSRNNLP